LTLTPSFWIILSKVMIRQKQQSIITPVHLNKICCEIAGQYHAYCPAISTH
jgi:hypothetical protein